MAGCCVPVKGKVQAHSTQSESRRLIKRSKRLKNVVERSAFQKWQFRKSARSPMRKIQPAMCSESLNRIRMPANRKQNKHVFKYNPSSPSAAGLAGKDLSRFS